MIDGVMCPVCYTGSTLMERDGEVWICTTCGAIWDWSELLVLRVGQLVQQEQECG